MKAHAIHKINMVYLGKGLKERGQEMVLKLCACVLGHSVVSDSLRPHGL